LQERFQTGVHVVEIDVSAVFPLLYIRKFQKIMLELIAHYGDTPLSISASTNKDNLE